MATVRNARRHVLDLTGGQWLAPAEERNIDTSAPHEQALIADGSLIVVDNTAAPAGPATHWNAGGRAYNAAYAGHDYDKFLPLLPEDVSELDDQVVALTAKASVGSMPSDSVGALKQQRLRGRRLGRMNVGKGVVTIRHDDGHGTDYSGAFQLLKARNLVATFAIPSTFPNTVVAGVTMLTTAQIVEMLQWGNEVACHTATHGSDATPYNTDTKLRAELRDSRAALEALSPLIRAELFVTPGTSGIFNDDSQWEDYQGQLVMATYLTSTGYSYDTSYWPNQEVYGHTPLACDTATLTQIKERIDRAVANRSVLHLSLHAYNLDGPGNLSTADWTAALDYMRAYMDAGLLANLTVTGGVLATGQPGEWEDIIEEGDFEDLPYAASAWGPWTVTGAPVLKTDGGADGSAQYVQVNNANHVSQSHFNVADSDAEGAHYRFRCKVRNSTGAAGSYDILLQDSTTPANWKVELAAAATTSWATVERCVTIPPGLDRVSVVLQSSGAGFFDFDSVEFRRI